MDLAELQVFLTVASERSFSKAAARLHRLHPCERAQRGNHHAPHRGRIVNHQDIVRFVFVRHRQTHFGVVHPQG